MTNITPVSELVKRANAEVETVPFELAQTLLNDENVLFVDIRDVRELWRDGKLPGAMHAPRGMLEFWVDPQSPYHKPEFSQGKKLVFYCASAWRSALATKAVQDMGLDNVSHLEGGFQAWSKNGGEVEAVEKKS